MRIGEKNLFVLGDRILVVPDEGEERTRVGLYLPQTVLDKDTVQSGRVVAIGPGLPLPDLQDEDEPWRASKNEAKHVPMQVDVGDRVVFLRKSSVEIKLDGKSYLILPQAAVLVVLRED